MTFELSECKLLYVKKSLQLFSGPDVYRMKAKKRGFCLIVNNLNFDNPQLKPRDGSIVDAIQLHFVFSQMGFVVIHKKDMTKKQMNDAFDSIVGNSELSLHDCFVAIILSHGDEKGVICAKDYNFRGEGFMTDMEIINKFDNSNCPALKSKPKLLFFSCCRGAKRDKLETDNSSHSQNGLSNIFVGYGTREGCVGYRDVDLGSIFGLAIANALINYAHNMELDDIFEEIRKWCQKKSTHHVVGSQTQQNPQFKKYEFNKKLFFNPGMCENALTEYRFDNYILKEIKLEPGKDKEFSKQFKIHSNMKYLNDERIVQYFSVWLKDDVDPHDKRLESSTLYVQMELCEKALRDIINEIENDSNLITFEKKTKRLTSLGYYIASQLFIETLEGVDYLHKQIPPIIHRGLKPENIMLKIGSNNRFVKIGDLGLVAVHEYADQSHTSLGHSDNTNAKYTAPEVLNSRNYNTKADIYSLGVILQELFKIDINGDYTNGGKNSSALMTKYKELNDLCYRMMDIRYSNRHDCEQILKNKHSWALSSEELRATEDLEKILNSSNINNSFVYSIIKLKLKQ